ncbi:MAG: FMN-binding negative transcriptional regulator [Cohaesibacteraceae bacterium]|nr:FMN-binding negative transcriptional regulator [Cohaesibacteraceae bacterium]
MINRFIRDNSLATLVSQTNTGMCANPLVMSLSRDKSGKLNLVGHMSRANPQWETTDTSQPVLAIFSGANAYISPSYYPSKQLHGRVVPTWNYIHVQVSGSVTFFHEAEEIRKLLQSLTLEHENSRQVPWAITDAPEKYINAQLRGVVGFVIRDLVFSAKAKVGQNKKPEDQDGMISGLSDDGENRMASLVLDNLNRD